MLQGSAPRAAVSLSKIFKWYKIDFEEHGGGMVNFINKYKQVGGSAIQIPV